MDQIQQSLCDMTKRKPACMTDRNILRSALADYLPNNKLKQNLLLNAFDNDVVQNLRRGTDITLSALNCISQLENDYGITKDAAFWSIQTWCYLLGLDNVADALVVLQPQNQTMPQDSNVNFPVGNEYKIGLGVYRAGTDFPAGELSVQADRMPKDDIFYKVSKTAKSNSNDGFFRDKIYVQMAEGQFLKLYAYGAGEVTFTVKLIKKGGLRWAFLVF